MVCCKWTCLSVIVLFSITTKYGNVKLPSVARFCDNFAIFKSREIFSKLGSCEKFVTIRYDEYSKIHNNRINVKQRCSGDPEFLVTELLAFSFVHHLLTVFCLIHKEIEFCMKHQVLQFHKRFCPKIWQKIHSSNSQSWDINRDI